jgi:hypothetical protein
MERASGGDGDRRRADAAGPAVMAGFQPALPVRATGLRNPTWLSSVRMRQNQTLHIWF